MRYIYLLLTFSLFVQLSPAFAQEITYSANNQSLKAVFSAVQKQSGYGFFYDKKLLASAKPISVEFHKASIQEVLQTIFKDQPLAYSIENKTILISKKELQKDVSLSTLDKKSPPLKKQVSTPTQLENIEAEAPEYTDSIAASKIPTDTKTPQKQTEAVIPQEKPDTIKLNTSSTKNQSPQIVQDDSLSSAKSKNKLLGTSYAPWSGKKMNYGFKGGLNSGIITYGELNSSNNFNTTDLYGGFFADRRLNHRFELGTELIFSLTGSYHYIELPIHLKYALDKDWKVLTGPKLDYIVDRLIEKAHGFSGEIGSQYKINSLFFTEFRYAHSFTRQIERNNPDNQNAFRHTFRFGLGVNFRKNESAGKGSSELGPMRFRIGLNAGPALTKGYQTVTGADFRMQTDFTSTIVGMITAGYYHYWLQPGFEETDLSYFPAKAV